MRVAVLDDYQGVALAMGPWDELGDAVTVTAFTDHVAGDDALIQRLAGFEVVVAMRERTPFPRARLERLPTLRRFRDHPLERGFSIGQCESGVATRRGEHDARFVISARPHGREYSEMIRNRA